MLNDPVSLTLSRTLGTRTKNTQWGWIFDEMQLRTNFDIQ